MIKKYVVLKVSGSWSEPVAYRDTLEEAIQTAWEVYFSDYIERMVCGYDIIVEESSFVGET